MSRWCIFAIGKNGSVGAPDVACGSFHGFGMRWFRKILVKMGTTQDMLLLWESILQTIFWGRGRTIDLKKQVKILKSFLFPLFSMQN